MHDSSHVVPRQAVTRRLFWAVCVNGCIPAEYSDSGGHQSTRQMDGRAGGRAGRQAGRRAGGQAHKNNYNYCHT